MHNQTVVQCHTLHKLTYLTHPFDMIERQLSAIGIYEDDLEFMIDAHDSPNRIVFDYDRSGHVTQVIIHTHTDRWTFEPTGAFALNGVPIMRMRHHVVLEEQFH